MADQMSVDNNGQAHVPSSPDEPPKEVAAEPAPLQEQQQQQAQAQPSQPAAEAEAATPDQPEQPQPEQPQPQSEQPQPQSEQLQQQSEQPQPEQQQDAPPLAEYVASLIEKLDRGVMKLSSTRQNTQYIGESIFKHVEPIPDVAALIDRAADSSPLLDSAIGSVVGLAISDSLGHPLEFVDVDEELPPYPKRRPHLTDELAKNGRPVYHNDYNRFDLCAGQWTDDTSMALCMADSLLVHRKFNGPDMRVRWFNWWFGGYNNAFRFSDHPRGSCGLGGNIAKSLEEVFVCKHAVPAEFSGAGEDAGNGSIMRLAPVPIAYHHDLAKAEDVAVRQSKATHPGNDASACCRFMTFFIIAAMRERRDAGDKIEDVAAFIQRTVDRFLETHPADQDSGVAKLHRLLRSAEPAGSTERNWNWKDGKLCIAETMALRQKGPRGKYNGYPVIPSYFGSYCMDGLAMALWAVNRTRTFEGAVLAAVNLLGDADTVGAIAGQMAGAIYGYKAMKAGAAASAWLQCLFRWDRNYLIPLRGLLLAMMQPEDSAVEKTLA